MIFWFLEQEMMQQKLQEIQSTNGQLPTRTCEAEEDGGHEQNRSPTFESLQLDTLSCFHVFVCRRS